MNKVRSALSAYCYCCGAIDTRALDVSSHVTLSSEVFNGADSSSFAAVARGGLVPRHGSSKSSSSTGRAGVDEDPGQAAVAAAASGDVVGLPYQQLFRQLLQVGGVLLCCLQSANACFVDAAMGVLSSGCVHCLGLFARAAGCAGPAGACP